MGYFRSRDIFDLGYFRVWDILEWDICDPEKNIENYRF